MKRIAIGLGVLAVLVLAAPAGAELCEKCKDGAYIMSVGECVECGGPTGSGAFKLCKKCSAKLGQCEHCRAPLKGAKPAPVKPAPTVPPVRIDTKKSGTYTSGKWKYEYQILAKGSRSEGSYGRLFFDGKKVPQPKGIKINDYYKTPWGRLLWVGNPPTRWGFHGWAPPEIPIANRAGKELPSPEKSVPDYLALLELDESHDDKTVSAFVGQEIVICLKGNPTTGYSWGAGKIEGDALGQVGEVKYVSDQPSRRVPGRVGRIIAQKVGVGGKYIFTFGARKTGTSKLTLEYKRGWEKDNPPAETFTLTVDVKADPTAERVRKLKAGIDSFKLALGYNGPQDKLLYRSLVLSVPTALVKAAPGSDYVIISQKQAEKIIEHLANDGFLNRAFDITNVLIDRRPRGPIYSMQVNSGKMRLHEYLGWDMKMLKRLDALRKVLDGEAAKAMDELLKRLEGQRKEWEKENPVTKS